LIPGQLDPDSRVIKPTESLFSAKEIECPVCFAKAEQQCSVGPNHVERARQSRWRRMNLLHSTE
jgi:hypothetical protein